MPFINSGNQHANWDDAIASWHEIANWTRLKPSETQLNRQIKNLLIFLSNEKDWLCNQYPESRDEIEKAINNSNYMAAVIDLANTAKHRILTKHIRVDAKDTCFYGRVETGNKIGRRLHYISIKNSKPIEIMEILRGALDEFEDLRSLLHEQSK